MAAPTHFSRDPGILATAYIANTDEMELVYRLSPAGELTPRTTRPAALT